MCVLNKVTVEYAHIFHNVDIPTSKVHMLIMMLPLLRHMIISWSVEQGYLLNSFVTRRVRRWYWVCKAMFLQTIQIILCPVQLFFHFFTFFYSNSTERIHRLWDSFPHFKLPLKFAEFITKTMTQRGCFVYCSERFLNSLRVKMKKASPDLKLAQLCRHLKSSWTRSNVLSCFKQRTKPSGTGFVKCIKNRRIIMNLASTFASNDFWSRPFFWIWLWSSLSQIILLEKIWWNSILATWHTSVLKSSPFQRTILILSCFKSMQSWHTYDML